MSLGIHIAKKSLIRDAKYKTMLDAIQAETQLLNLNACQIYSHGPRSYTKNPMSHQAIKKYCEEQKVDLSTHGTYVSVSIWKVNQKNKSSEESKKQIEHIKDMLSTVKQLGGSGVVVHLPKKLPEIIVETLEVLSENANLLKLRDSNGGCPKLILEMPASKPDDKTYETSDKLNNLCELIHNNKKINLDWCLCIDTSHQWSCGIKMNERHSWNDWLADLTEFTRNKIEIIHLNGNSSVNFGRGKDIHEIIMSPTDGIWHNLMSEEMLNFIKTEGNTVIKEEDNFFDHLSESELEKIKNSSLYDVILFAKKRNITLILEVKRGDFIYTKYAIDIINGLL